MARGRHALHRRAAASRRCARASRRSSRRVTASTSIRERILITAGASGALLLTMAAVVDAGDEILMPDPSYPCNRHFVAAFDGVAKLIPAGPEDRFQLTAAMVEQHWGPRTRGVLVASPSNPTGTSIEPAELRRIVDAVAARGGITIVDEIYLELSYTGPGEVAHRSALETQRRRHRHQQLLEVLPHDRLAARLGRRAAVARRRRSRSSRRTCSSARRRPRSTRRSLASSPSRSRSTRNARRSSGDVATTSCPRCASSASACR